jgi:cobalt-zinc-cadmium efflux system membrane fusion protein
LISEFKAKGDWCAEHGLPESHCRLCNPGLTFAQEPVLEIAGTEEISASVYFPTNARHCATSEATIQFASAETAERAGLVCVPVVSAGRRPAAEAPAEVVFDETRFAAITARIQTVVVQWLVQPGDKVREGQALAILESPEMPQIKSEYLQALAEVQLRQMQSNRADTLFARGLISVSEKQEADRELQTARAQLAGAQGQLRGCGISPSDLNRLSDTGSSVAQWNLTAQTAGVLLERIGRVGQLVESGSQLALIGDPSQLWVEARVRQEDAPLFVKGKVIEFTSDGDALSKVAGRVIWVSQFVDPTTRSAVVRAEIPNSDGALAAHQFGRLVLPEHSDSNAVAVPRDAVQWEGCCNVVFVQDAPDRYTPHKVTLERGEPGYYTVTSGIHSGDRVVVQGSYLLKTELRKGSLGAGCCGVAPKS